jgi:sulfofructose kinase
MSGALVVLVGQAAQDCIFAVPELPSKPIKYRADHLTLVGGGLSANAAVAVARLGGKARLVGRLGDDAIGEEIVRGLQAEDVDCAWVKRFEGRRSPLSMVAVEPQGERIIINYTDPGMPDATDWLPEELPPHTRAVMGDVRWPSGVHHIFGLARRLGLPAVLDADRAILDPTLVEHATHIVYSAQALSEETGCGDLKRGLTALRWKHAYCLAVTDGADGTWFTNEGDILHCPACPIDVVDTLAAGDTFHGALTLALAEDLRDLAAFRFASAAAALKCTRFGGRNGIPYRGEVEELMRRAA